MFRGRDSMLLTFPSVREEVLGPGLGCLARSLGGVTFLLQCLPLPSSFPLMAVGVHQGVSECPCPMTGGIPDRTQLGCSCL